MKLATVGLLLPVDPPEGGVARVVGHATAAEDVGFDSVWVGEHVRWHTPIMEPVAVLGAVSQSTSRVRLGTAVMLAGLRHPVHIANALATLDHLSDGRITAGFGTGTDAGGDFRAVGVSTLRSGQLIERAVPAIRGLLRGEGLYSSNDSWSADASPGLVAKQTPLPVVLGGHGDAALDRAARLGDGWIGAFIAPDRMSAKVALLRDRLAADSRSLSDFSVLQVVYAQLAKDSDAAEAQSDDYFRRFYGQPASRVAKSSAFGSAETIHSRLMEYRRAGVDGVILAQPTMQRGTLRELVEVGHAAFTCAVGGDSAAPATSV